MWLVTGNMFAVFSLQLLCKSPSFVVRMDPSLNLHCIVVVDIYIYIYIYICFCEENKLCVIML